MSSHRTRNLPCRIVVCFQRDKSIFIDILEGFAKSKNELLVTELWKNTLSVSLSHLSLSIVSIYWHSFGSASDNEMASGLPSAVLHRNRTSTLLDNAD